jgi:hypothetical protein
MNPAILAFLHGYLNKTANVAQQESRGRVVAPSPGSVIPNGAGVYEHSDGSFTPSPGAPSLDTTDPWWQQYYRRLQSNQKFKQFIAQTTREAAYTGTPMERFMQRAQGHQNPPPTIADTFDVAAAERTRRAGSSPTSAPTPRPIGPTSTKSGIPNRPAASPTRPTSASLLQGLKSGPGVPNSAKVNRPQTYQQPTPKVI